MSELGPDDPGAEAEAPEVGASPEGVAAVPGAEDASPAEDALYSDNASPTELGVPAPVVGGQLAVSGVIELGMPQFVPRESTLGIPEPVEEAPVWKLGRYVVLEVLEPIGDAQQFRVYDPQERRELVIERIAFGPEERDRLEASMRDGRAMLAFDDPHLARVLDVSSEADSVMVVVQARRGTPLVQWVHDRKPGWAETSRIVRQLVRAVADLHAEGIVHGGIRGDHVIVDVDGRAYLQSSGWAWRHGRASALAQTGLAARYLAPEQHEGLAADERSDEWALGLVLWEVLCEQEAFADVDEEDLVVHKRRGAPQWPPWSDVPRWLRRAVDRAMHPDPQRRHGSLSALAHALRTEGAVRRHKWRMAVLGLGTLCALGLGTRTLVPLGVDACVLERQIEPPQWAGGMRDRVEQALLGTQSAVAEQTFERVDARMSAFAEDARSVHRGLCTMGHESALAHRRCIEEANRWFEAVVAALTEPRPRTLHHAVDLVQASPDLERCEALLEDPLARTFLQSATQNDPELDWLDAGLTRVEVRMKAGAVEQAFDELEPLHAQVLSRSEPFLRARSFRLRGRLLRMLGRPDEAESAFEEAMSIALRNGGGREGALAAIARLELLARLPGARDRAKLVADMALSWAQGSDPGGTLEAEALAAIARAEQAAGHHERALELLAQALELHEQATGAASPQVADTLVTRVSQRLLLGRTDDAQRDLQRAQSIYTEAYGAAHPRNAIVVETMALVHQRAGRVHESQAQYERALEMYEAALGLHHPEVARVLGNLGAMLVEDQRFDEAIAPLERAFLIVQRNRQGGGKTAVRLLLNLGGAAIGKERWAEAISYLDQALTKARAANAFEDVARVYSSIANLHARRGEYRRAVVAYERALEHLEDRPDASTVLRARLLAGLGWTLNEARDASAAERLRAALDAWGPDAPEAERPRIASTWLVLGALERRRNNLVDALHALEQAEKLGEAMTPDERARVRFELAQVLWVEDAAGRERAKQLAAEAAELYADLGESYAGEARSVRRWLSARDGTSRATAQAQPSGGALGRVYTPL